MFERKFPRGTFESKLLRNEELPDVYQSFSTVTAFKSRRLRWAEHVARICETSNAYFHLKRRRREDNIKVDLRHLG